MSVPQVIVWNLLQKIEVKMSRVTLVDVFVAYSFRRSTFLLPDTRSHPSLRASPYNRKICFLKHMHMVEGGRGLEKGQRRFNFAFDEIPSRPCHTLFFLLRLCCLRFAGMLVFVMIFGFKETRIVYLDEVNYGFPMRLLASRDRLSSMMEPRYANWG